MMKPEDFLRRWGEGSFVHATTHALGDVNIPEVSKQFLIEAGLPREPMLGLIIDFPSDRLPRLSEVIQANSRLAQKFDRYRVIGRNRFYLAYHCIDETTNGHIVRVSSDGQRQTLINSSIPQFAESCLVYREFREATKDLVGSDDDFEDRPHDEEPMDLQQLPEIDLSEASAFDNWDALLSAINELEKELQRIDPEMFQNPENTWPITIEQLSTGMI